MLLFKSDEATHGGFYDYNTSNTSALRMALMYKKMGIKNYAFQTGASGEPTGTYA